MCRELEEIGLPDPMFNDSMFILKATVRSASYAAQSTEKTSIQDDIASIGLENASIQKIDALFEILQKNAKEVQVSVREAADAKKIIETTDALQVITSRDSVTNF